MADIYARVEPLKKICNNILELFKWKDSKMDAHILKILVERGVDLPSLPGTRRSVLKFLSKGWDGRQTNYLLSVIFSQFGHLHLDYVSFALKWGHAGIIPSILERVPETRKSITYWIEENHCYLAKMPYFEGYRETIRSLFEHGLIIYSGCLKAYVNKTKENRLKEMFLLSSEYFLFKKEEINAAKTIINTWLKCGIKLFGDRLFYFKRVLEILQSKFPCILEDSQIVKWVLDHVLKDSLNINLSLLHLSVVQFGMPLDLIDPRFFTQLYQKLKIYRQKLNRLSFGDARELFSRFKEYPVDKVDMHANIARYIMREDYNYARILLRMGIDPMETDENGNNSLHVAAMKTCSFYGITKNELRLLVSEIFQMDGVDVNVTNNEGLTPRQIIENTTISPSVYQMLVSKSIGK